MTIQTTSRNAHADGVLAVLNARLGAMATPRAAYEYDDAPTSGGDYVLVSLSRMFGGSDRLGGLSNTMWRVTVRAVGSVTNVGVLLDVCTRALEESSITVGGVESTGFRFETETDVEQDEDDTALYSGLRSFTYAF